jgi:hypothetical protein
MTDKMRNGKVIRDSREFLWTVAALLSLTLLTTFATIGIVVARGFDWGMIVVAVPSVILSTYLARQFLK